MGRELDNMIAFDTSRTMQAVETTAAPADMPEYPERPDRDQALLSQWWLLWTGRQANEGNVRANVTEALIAMGNVARAFRLGRRMNPFGRAKGRAARFEGGARYDGNVVQAVHSVHASVLASYFMHVNYDAEMENARSSFGEAMRVQRLRLMRGAA
jgi:hypothetical protein